MGITKFRVMATNELNSTGLIIYTEAENLHWVQYILDEFCRIEKAKFFIKVKNYNRQLKKNDNAIYYLEGVKSDIFQVQKREFFKNNNIEIINYKDFQILDKSHSRLNHRINYDLFWNIFYYMSRLNEFLIRKTGNYTRSYSFKTKMPENFRWEIPHVNFLFKEFKKYLENRFPRLQFEKSDKAIIELSHDLDYIEKTPILILKQTVFNGFNFIKSPSIKLLKRTIKFIITKSNYWNFDYWQDIEKEYNLKSIFYVYSKVKWGIKQSIFDPYYDVSKNKKLIEKLKEINNNGWQIGLHGSFYSYKNFDLLKSEKNQLEEELKIEITKNRQHWLNYDEFLTPKLHEKLFEVDSTIGWNDRIGFRASIASKYRPFNHIENRPFNFLITPQIVMDSNIYDYGSNFADKILIAAGKMINICKELGNTEFSVSWHNRTLSKDYNWEKGYIKLIQTFKK